MMDANYVHQRDIATILETLHQQIEEANKEKGKIPDEELSKKIKDLVSSADRDLKLKAQTITRTKLTKSNVIPVNFAPLVQLDGHPFLTPYVPLPDPKTQTHITFTNTSNTPRVKKKERLELHSPNKNLGSVFPKKSEIPNPLYGFNSKSTKKSQIKDQISVEPKVAKTLKKSSKLKSVQSSFTESSSKSARILDQKSNTEQSNQAQPLAKTSRSLKSSRSKESQRSLTKTAKNPPISPKTIRQNLPERPKTSTAIPRVYYKTVPKSKTVLTSRRRGISEYVPKLPQVDKHDPKADPPPISDSLVDKYGLQQLTETRHIRDENVPDHLKGLIVVSPFKKDIGADYRNFKQNYYLDLLTPAKIEKEEPQMDLLQIPSDEDDAALSTATGHYIFTLNNGIPVSTSPEFQAFKRNNSNIWESIEIILNMLAPICEQYGLSDIKVDGNVIMEFTKYEPDEIPVTRLFRCFKTLPRIKKISPKVGFGFVGPKAEEKAAIFIQSVWRGFNARRVVRMIKRQNAAAKMIQDQWRVYRQFQLLTKQLEDERQKKLLLFESFQTDSTSYKPSEPHVMVQLISSFDSVEIGRISFLNNPNVILILYLRKAMPPEINNLVRDLFSDTQRLHILTSSLRLPFDFSIEDMFASDLKAMTQVKLLAGMMPIYIIPTVTHYALVDSSIKLNALALAPSPTRAQMYVSRESMRRILKNSGTVLFESSNEIFDNDSLCTELSGLAVSNISIQTWVLHTNDDSIGWLNMSDFVLMEQLRAHKDTLTEEDLLDKSFREVLKNNISKDLKHVLNTTCNNNPENFLHNFFTVGGTIEAGPQHLKSGPAVAFFVPPIGSPKIVGSWETLYISQYEPFATIHPAFTVAREKLKKKSLKIAAECSSKRLIGINTVQYFYSARNILDSDNLEDQYKMKLTPDNLLIGQIDVAMNDFFAQALLHTNYDQESMSIGPSNYAYVQRKVKMPAPVDISLLREKFQDFSIPIDEKIFFLQSFNDNSVYSLLVVEENPEKLVRLVYRTLATLVDFVFEIDKYPEAEILKYLSAIEFLKEQYDTTHELSSTLLMKKVKMSPLRRSIDQRLFQFDKLNDEASNLSKLQSEETQEDSSFVSTISNLE